MRFETRRCFPFFWPFFLPFSTSQVASSCSLALTYIPTLSTNGLSACGFPIRPYHVCAIDEVQHRCAQEQCSRTASKTLSPPHPDSTAALHCTLVEKHKDRFGQSSFAVLGHTFFPQSNKGNRVAPQQCLMSRLSFMPCLALGSLANAQ